MTVERDRLLAHYYDLEYRDYKPDVESYVQLADALDPGRDLPLLELGCGTGRVTIALAEAGFRVVGVDTSRGMLDVCARAARERHVSGDVTPVLADMRDLKDVPPGPYNIAFCALNTFAYLASREDQLAMLAAVKGRLLLQGVFVVDLTPPWPHLWPPSDGEIIHQGTYADNRGGVVHKLVTGHAEPSIQAHHVTLMYDHEAVDGKLTRISQQIDLRWTGRYEMEGLLRQSGYTVRNLFGSYELDDFGDESERMMFVAQVGEG
jgi:SAM-dependent methyltransferase